MEKISIFSKTNIFGIIFFVLGSIGVGMTLGLYLLDKKELIADVAVITIVCWMGYLIIVPLWKTYKTGRKIYKNTKKMIEKMPKPEP